MTTSDDEHRTTDWRTAALLIAPAVLLGALVAHPYIEGRLPNNDAAAAEVAGGTMLWGTVHLAAAVASALIILAFLAVRSYLHDAGEDRLSPVGLPFVIVGSTLFAVLPGMEFVSLAAAETGATTAEIAAAQDAITGWFMPVLLASALTFSIGALLFAAAISKVRIGSGRLTRVVVGAMVVMALSRLVPLAAAQFYLQTVAGVAALWPLAYAMRRRRVPSPA